MRDVAEKACSRTGRGRVGSVVAHTLFGWGACGRGSCAGAPGDSLSRRGAPLRASCASGIASAERRALTLPLSLAARARGAPLSPYSSFWGRDAIQRGRPLLSGFRIFGSPLVSVFRGKPRNTQTSNVALAVGAGVCRSMLLRTGVGEVKHSCIKHTRGQLAIQRYRFEVWEAFRAGRASDTLTRPVSVKELPENIRQMHQRSVSSAQCAQGYARPFPLTAPPRYPFGGEGSLLVGAHGFSLFRQLCVSPHVT